MSLYSGLFVLPFFFLSFLPSKGSAKQGNQRTPLSGSTEPSAALPSPACPVCWGRTPSRRESPWHLGALPPATPNQTRPGRSRPGRQRSPQPSAPLQGAADRVPHRAAAAAEAHPEGCGAEGREPGNLREDGTAWQLEGKAKPGVKWLHRKDNFCSPPGVEAVGKSYDKRHWGKRWVKAAYCSRENESGWGLRVRVKVATTSAPCLWQYPALDPPQPHPGTA